MTPQKQTLLLPVLLVTVGTGWLLTTLGYVPNIDWVWTLSLAVLGVVTLALGGIDKVTIVIGPFFIFASFLSILRQTGRLHLNVEMPILIIALGILLFVARLPAIPVPRWMVEDSRTRRE